MADEYVCDRAHGFGLAGAKQSVYAAAQYGHHFLHDAQVIQGGHQRGKEDDHRQQVECDREAAVVPGQVAEYELTADAPVIDDVLDARDHGVEERLPKRKIKDETGNGRLCQERGNHGFQPDRAPVFGQQQGQADYHRHPDKTHQYLHAKLSSVYVPEVRVVTRHSRAPHRHSGESRNPVKYCVAQRATL